MKLCHKGYNFFVRFLYLCKSVLSFFEFNFRDDFVHQVIGITSRCQACSIKFLMFSLNITLEEFVLRSLSASL